MGEKISVMCKGFLNMEASKQRPFLEHWRRSIYVMKEAQTCFMHLAWFIIPLASETKCRFVQLVTMFFSAEEAITMLMRAMNA
jgi:hypothetical protein